jgi:hypothetical protein
MYRKQPHNGGPSTRVSCSLSVEEYEWVTGQRLEFSAILRRKIAELRIKQEDDATKPEEVVATALPAKPTYAPQNQADAASFYRWFEANPDAKVLTREDRWKAWREAAPREPEAPA